MIIVYGDKSIRFYDGYHAVPVENVQAIVYPDPAKGGANCGTICIEGWDYYLLEGQSWVGVNGEVDLVDHVLHCNPKKVLKGRMLPRHEWVEISAIIDRYRMPPKSAIARRFEIPRQIKE